MGHVELLPSPVVTNGTVRHLDYLRLEVQYQHVVECIRADDRRYVRDKDILLRQVAELEIENARLKEQLRGGSSSRRS